MAASAAMIVAGLHVPAARAQDADSAPPPSNSLVLVNQIQAQRDQMQQMQGQIEVLQHELQQLKQASKEQYLDLDSRVGKLEHAQPAASASAGAAADAAPPSASPNASAAVATDAASAASAGGAPSDQAAAQADYDTAFKALRASNYVESARGFRAFIDKYPASPLVPNAYYWLGGSYYVTQNFKPALAAYQALLRHDPDNSKAAEAQLRVADCQIALKQFAAARATLHAMIKANPGTPLAKRAQARLQDVPPAAGGK